MLIPSSNVNTTPELRIFILTGFLRFFQRFTQINVGGGSAHLSSFGKRTREPRLARPQKGMLRQGWIKWLTVRDEFSITQDKRMAYESEETTHF